MIAKGPILLGAAFLGLTGVAGAILLADEQAATANATEVKPAPIKAESAILLSSLRIDERYSSIPVT